MRVEVSGAQITDAVVDVVEKLQTEPEVTGLYIDTIDELTRSLIIDHDATLEECDSDILSRLRVLQMIRRDILTIARPEDVNDPANDIPAAQL